MSICLLLRFAFCLFCFTVMTMLFKWSVDACVVRPDVSRSLTSYSGSPEAICRKISRLDNNASYHLGASGNLSQAARGDQHPLVQFFSDVPWSHPTLLLGKVPGHKPSTIGLILLVLFSATVFGLLWEWIAGVIKSAQAIR